MPKSVRFLLLMLAMSAGSIADARQELPQVRLEVQSRDMAFGGASFGEYGQYEKITAIAHMRIDPEAGGNLGVVDLALAPRAADGMVEYDTDVVILRPADAKKARRVLLYEVVNRGMRLLGMMTGGGFDVDAPGDGLVMRQGYTVVASGWQSDIAPAIPGMAGLPLKLVAARFPVATQDGKPITGRVSTERIFEDLTGNRIELPYGAASLDQSGAELTVRATGRDAPVTIPASDWSFDGDRAITLKRPQGFDAGAIYRISYIARDPVVAGLGFAATRDLISWLRHAPASDGNPLADIAGAPCEKDAQGNCVNPAGGAYSSAVAFGGSQSGRYLRDFLWQGFNRDLADRRVFDGVIPFIPGARQTFTNFRFGEPGRFSRQHEDHDVPGFSYPFTYATLPSPTDGKSDGIFKSCIATGTCPKLFHIDTSAEFWQAGASLAGTGGTGGDVAFPADVRAYMIAGGAHAPGFDLHKCRYPVNPLNYAPVLRTLVLAMVEWAAGRAEPPASAWPSVAKGELVPFDTLEGPVSETTGLEWPKVINRPEAPEGKAPWPIFVPALDADGNDAAGIHLPQVAAPTGTYLGWNLRKPGFADGELCFPEGAYIPFAADAATRGDDPRLSLAERYPDPGARTELYGKAADALVREGFLLGEDAARLKAQAGGK